MKQIDDNAFLGMSPVLQEIDLHHNNLTKVRNFLCFCPSTVKLFQIPVAALKEITTLLRLDLSNNSIGDLGETDAFPNLPKVSRLRDSFVHRDLREPL